MSTPNFRCLGLIENCTEMIITIQPKNNLIFLLNQTTKSSLSHLETLFLKCEKSKVKSIFDWIDCPSIVNFIIKLEFYL